MLPKWRSYPKPPGYVDKSAIWKKRLSYGYLFFSANAFMLVLYGIMKGKGDWVDYFGLREEGEGYKYSSQFWIQRKSIQDAKVYRVSGFNFEDITDKVYERNETPENKD